jgi:hypothetical protein
LKTKIKLYKTDKVAGKIAGWIIKCQTKVSDFMNKRLSKLSIKRTKVLLVVFCLFWGGLSIYFIVYAVLNKKPHTLKVDPLNLPQHFINDENSEREDRVGTDTYKKIQEYKKYMDSIHQTIRPGLLDSMNMLEQIYLSQQKKEAYEK